MKKNIRKKTDMKRSLIVKLASGIIGALVACLVIYGIKFCHYVKVFSSINDVMNYTTSYIEINDLIKSRNQKMQSKIFSAEEFFQCISNVRNDLSKFIEEENCIITINTDSIIIYYKVDESSITRAAIKVSNIEIDSSFAMNKCIKIASFSNQVYQQDTIVFNSEKAENVKEFVVDSIKIKIRQKTESFLSSTHDYYLYGNWMYVVFKYNSTVNNYSSEISKDVDYIQETFIVNLKTTLHNYLLANDVSFISIKIQIPIYSPIPPPTTINP